MKHRNLVLTAFALLTGVALADSNVDPAHKHAYGANLGWIDMRGDVSHGAVIGQAYCTGYVWSANAGWIGLSNAQACVRTTTLDPGPDRDGDGLPDAWEYARTGGTNILSGGGHDADHDGASDLAECLADTDPLDPDDRLEVVAIAVSGTTNTVRWTARPTRSYRLEATNRLPSAVGEWPDAGPGVIAPPVSSPAMATVSGVTETTRFYRVRAIVPLPN